MSNLPRQLMKAIIINDFKQAPRWGIFNNPIPQENEVLIKVKAAALSNLVKARANGTHYSSIAKFPFIPGVDGVGQLEDGSRVYFSFPRHPMGTMAEYSVSNKDSYILLPDDLEDVIAASIANPVMSSWAALVYRAKMVPGETVLINGASGASGGLAIKVAKHLGAKKVIVTARHHHLDRLSTLGADQVISLSSPSEELAANLKAVFSDQHISIILDYLWGSSAEAIIRAIGHAHLTNSIRFVQIGSMSGDTIPLNAFPLRSTGLQLLGSGLGSLTNQELLSSIRDAFKVAHHLNLKVDTETVPMADAEKTWDQSHGITRVVFTLS